MRLLKRILAATVVVILILVSGTHLYLKYWVSEMPGESFTAVPQPPDSKLLELAERLRGYVEDLSYDRSVYNPEGLKKAADYIKAGFVDLGITPLEQAYTVDQATVMARLERLKKPSRLYGSYEIDGQVVTNYWLQIDGTDKPDELLIISAHYDTVPRSPGAGDDATGVAGLFEVARHLLQNPPKVSVLLVAFTCEEFPVGYEITGGSNRFADYLLAERARAGLPEPIGILSLETLGNFSDKPNSQAYPAPLGFYYPKEGNFVAFVGDGTSRGFVRKCVTLFREVARIPSQGAAIPTRIVKDVARSDHAPFIDRGVPGLMVTDTANFRIPNNYHTPEDTPDKVDYIKLARIIQGIIHLSSEWQ